MKDFEIPTNIRQIGGISDGLRIYMEDYVFTYLRQIAEGGENSERTAFLVGKHIVVDSQPTIFINGALQAAYTENIDGVEQFSVKSYNHAAEQIEMYFKGYEIVGWMLSQPGYGVHINASYAEYHLNSFNKTYHALFVMDPIEKLNAFYIWDKNHKKVEECKGYFIYYKQNEGMQDYMLNNKVTKIKQPVIAEERKKKPHAAGVADVSAKRTPIKRTAQKREEPLTAENAEDAESTENTKETPQMMLRSPVRRSYANTEVVNAEYKRVTNMLISLSAVLFVICFIMGAGLIQSDGRINRLEAEVTSLGQSNELMSTQIRQIAAMDVFAGGDAVTVQPQVPAQTLPPAQTPAPTPTPGQATDGQAPAVQTPTPPPATAPPVVPTPAPPAVPTPTPPAQPPAAGVQYRIYTVQPNDTLFGIVMSQLGDANRMNEVMELNGITDADRITAGLELRIPY